MTRANIELTAALLAVLVLAALLTVFFVRDTAPATTGVAIDGAARTLPAPVPALAEGNIGANPAPAGSLPQVPPDVLARDRAFIGEAFPALSSWALDEVKPLLSTTALNATTDAELVQVMTTLSERLGTLQYFESPEPVGTPGDLVTTGSSATLQPYAFTAYFEDGAAEVNLVLEKQARRSLLYSFDIHIPN